MLGFGGKVADLSATLTLDDDGFMRGMADASAKLDAYNAKLKEQSVGSRLSTMASRDYASQLYKEAKAADQATQSHGRLYNMLQTGQRHWKLLGAGAAGAGVGILALTGNLGTLTAALPVLGGALTALLAPFTSLAAVAVAAAGPLTVFSTVLGGIGLGALLGFKSAMVSAGPQFAPFRRAIDSLKDGFGTLSHTLAQDFMPFFMKVAPIATDILGEFQKLANMAGKGGLSGLFKGLTQGGFQRLNQDFIKLISPIGDVIARVIKFAFGRGGREGQSMIVSNFNRFAGWADKAFAPIIKWFDKQHFTKTGARWASELTASAAPVIINGLWNAAKSVFTNLNAWGKLGMIAGAAFAAQFFSAGLLGKGLLAGGKGLAGLLGGGAAAGAGAGAGVGAGEAAAGGAGAAGADAAGVGGLISGAAIAAVAAVAVPAALVYLSSRQNPKDQNKYGITPGVHPRGPGSSGYVPGSVSVAAAKDEAALKRVSVAEKNLNQYIKDGGKSASGWKLAVGQATKQADTAQAAIKGLAAKGIISANQAASDGKKVLGQYVSQEDAIARKATAASHNTAMFGAATRAQYAHVAALARTSADLAAAIGSIPSRKYVSLVLSITENLKTQGNAPGQTRTQQGLPSQRGSYIGGSGSGDIVHAMLEPGEGVINRNAVRALGGAGAINAINQAVPRFQGGGLVPPGRHKKEKRNAYRSRVSSWLSNAVSSRFNRLDFGLQLADRIAQRDDSEGNFSGEISQLAKEQRIRGEEITLYGKGRRIARRFGLGGLARQYSQAEQMLHQDILDAADTIKGLRGQVSGQTSGVALATQIAAFLAVQQGFISQYAGNIRLTGSTGPAAAAGPAPAAASGSASASSASPNVTIHNHFVQTPPDSFVHIRKARLQAAAVFQ